MSDLKNQPKSFWREKLDDMQFRVTREAATEAPFTGKYWNHKEAGDYKCVCCGTPLFESIAKYDSGCGWPSFFQAKEQKSGKVIEERPDHSHGMNRIEVLCKNCGAHLGHIFEDGPEPTGVRYCINSASLDFAPKK